MNPKKYLKVFAVVLLCGLGFALYSNTLQSPFQFDDVFYLTDNYTVKSMVKVQDLWRDPDIAKRWVGFLTLAWNYALGGENVLGYHLFNICVHIFNALLVYWFASLLFSHSRSREKQAGRWHQNKGILAFLAAAVFLAHPIQTQAVTYICQRVTSLAAMFYLLAICCYWKARFEERRCGGARRTLYLLAVAACVVLGFFTKENAVTIPVMLFILEIYFNPDLKKRSLLRGALCLFFVLILAYAVYPLSFKRIFAAELAQGITWDKYLITQFRVILKYLQLMVFPIGQNLDYDYPLSHSLFEVRTLLSFFAVAGLFTGAVYLFNKNRLLSFGIIWFFVTISVESSIFPLGDLIFEHRLYLPSVGIIVFFLTVFANLCAGKRRTLIAGSLVVVGLLSYLAYQRNLVWRSERSLWEDVVRKSPIKCRPHINLGKAYYQEKRYDKALEVLNRAVELEPRNFLAYLNRGNVYKALKKYQKAYEDYEMVRHLEPAYAPAYYNFGNLMFEQRRYVEAEMLYNSAIGWLPQYAAAYFGKANALKAQKKYDEALKFYERALHFKGPEAEIYNNIANTYKETRRFDEAVQYYSKAIRLKPDLHEAYNNRGSIYHLQERYDLALSDFFSALKIDPRFAVSYYNRGNLYATLAKWPEAIADYTKAIELSNLPEAHLNRALIYKSQGEYQKAIVDFSHVLRLAPQYAQVYWQRGLCYEALQEHALAQEDFLKAKHFGFPADEAVAEHKTTAEDRP